MKWFEVLFLKLLSNSFSNVNLNIVGGVGGSCNIRVMTCSCTLRIRPELTSEREYFLCRRENILFLREYLFGQKKYFPLSERKSPLPKRIFLADGVIPTVRGKRIFLLSERIFLEDKVIPTVRENKHFLCHGLDNFTGLYSYTHS